jgi:hypothetical protein
MQSEHDLVLDYQRFGRRGFEDLAAAMLLVGVGAGPICRRNERREHRQSFELEVS